MIAPANATATDDSAIRLAAAQPLGIKLRLMRRWRRDPERRAAHFRQWNIGAATYDAAYCQGIAVDYLPYLSTWVERAAAAGARLLLLPEFALVPGVLASPLPGAARNPSARADALALYDWAATRYHEWAATESRRHGLYLAAATITARASRLYNTGILHAPTGDLVGTYDKVHLPCDEKESTTPGTTYPVWETELGRIGFAICYDIQYPEHTACLKAMGAQIVLHPSAGFTLPDEATEMGLARLRVRASDHHTTLLYSCHAPESSWQPHSSCVIAPNGDCRAVVRGRRTGLAVAGVATTARRAWPGDAASAPDREAQRRSLRCPATYSILTDTSAVSPAVNL